MSVRSNLPATALFLSALSLSCLTALGQSKPTASIHGQVTDPAGAPIPNAIVVVTPDAKAAKYQFTADANGAYKGDGIEPGTYVIELQPAGKPVDLSKPVDVFQNVKIDAGADLTENFDLTRAEYLAKLTPEQRKQIEDVKAKNSEALKANSVIKNLNADLQTARADIKAKNYAEADTLMTKDSQLKPDAAVIWLELGNAQVGEKKYPEATTSLQKAVQLEGANPKPNAELLGGANNALGEAFAGQNKVPDAQAAYEAAAKANPPQAGVYFTNETIILARSGQAGDAVTASADKAIAADPNRPIPYYLKAQSLISKATVDPKTQKIQAPPGCAEAYQKYLELAPDGQFAADAKNILESMGQKVNTKYTAGKK